MTAAQGTASPAAPAPRPRRPGARALMMMVRAEGRMVARDVAGLVTPFVLPLLILLTSAAGASRQEIVAGRTVLDLYVLPLVLVMVLAFVGVLNMPSFLAYYRKSGILRRLAVTPASPVLVLLAQTIVSAVQAALGILVAAAVAALAFGANPPLHLGSALLALALTAAAMYATGMIVAAVAPSPSAGTAIGLLGFLGLGALGGMFGGARLAAGAARRDRRAAPLRRGGGRARGGMGGPAPSRPITGRARRRRGGRDGRGRGAVPLGVRQRRGARHGASPCRALVREAPSVSRRGRA